MEHIRIKDNRKLKFTYDKVNKRVHIELWNEVESEYEYYDYIDISYKITNEDFISLCERYAE